MFVVGCDDCVFWCWKICVGKLGSKMGVCSVCVWDVVWYFEFV